MTDVHRWADAPGKATRNPAGWLAPITDLRSARSAARHGAVAGLVLCGIYASGLMLSRRPDGFAATNSPVDIEEALSFAMADGIIILILFLSWRVSTTRGYISALILAAWFAIQTAVIVLGGRMGVIEAIFWIAIAAGIVNGVRGCWKARKFRALANMAEQF